MSNDPDFDVLLLNVAENNDRVAFATLFSHFAPRLSQMFDPAKASASTWIFTIARNLRIDRFRNENRPELDPNDPALVREPEPLADDQLAVKDRRAAVREYVATLPEEQRQAVHLSFVEGLSHQEIADRLELPLGTVKSRLRLSFSKLRPMLRTVS